MADSISRTVQLQREGVVFEGFLSRPPVEGVYPGMIVIQEWYGLVDHIKEMCLRFARQGYVALAPDLYHGEIASGPEQAMRLSSSAHDGTMMADVQATFDYLRQQPFVRGDRIGIIGYCFGGRVSLLFGGQNREVAATVVYYGRLYNPEINERQPRHPIALVPNLNSPLLGVFGEDDASISVGDVGRFEEALRSAGKSYEIKIYPGCPHAFFNDTNPERYRPEAAGDAWQRTLSFLERHLKA